MSLSRLQIRHKGAARALIFIMLTPIFFRVLYGVPPLPGDYVIDFAPTTLQLASKNAPKTLTLKTPSHTNSQVHQAQSSDQTTFDSIHFNSNLKLSSTKTKPTDAPSKRLAPIKTFKSKLIPKKNFNPSDSFDLSEVKINGFIIQHISPSLGKRYLTTHSNAPPALK